MWYYCTKILYSQGCYLGVPNAMKEHYADFGVHKGLLLKRTGRTVCGRFVGRCVFFWAVVFSRSATAAHEKLVLEAPPTTAQASRLKCCQTDDRGVTEGGVRQTRTPTHTQPFLIASATQY